jgi:diguanylate cyclase
VDVSKTVLVIEHDPALQYFVRVVLEQAGLDVQATHSVPLGIHLARIMGPDLVLCDVFLPEQGGPRVVAALRKEGSTCGIPVVYLSSDPSPSLRDRCLAHGAADVLEQPFTPAELLQTVFRAFPPPAVSS